MEKRIENKMIMLKTSAKVLKQNEPIWNTSVPMVTDTTELDSLIAEIEAIQESLSESNTGLSTSKNKQKEILVKRAFTLVSFIFAMAKRMKDDVLVEKVDYPISELQSLRDDELPAKCLKISALGRSLLPQVAEFGATEAKLNELDELTQQYKESLPDRRISITEQKAANKKMKELVAQAIDLVTNQIDRLMGQFELENPEFFEAYRNARKVVAYGTRYEKPVTPEAPAKDGN